MAFINVYGPLYMDDYESLIVKLNDITQEFLSTEESKPIYSIYMYYSRAKNDNKKEVLGVIKNSLKEYNRNQVK